MACVLQEEGAHFTAPADSIATVTVQADNTKLTAATYNGQKIPVQDNKSTKFTVIKGPALLQLALAGPAEDVTIAEDCGNGQTQPLIAWENEFRPAVGLTIIGKA
jgi:hypothetical protein